MEKNYFLTQLESQIDFGHMRKCMTVLHVTTAWVHASMHENKTFCLYACFPHVVLNYYSCFWQSLRAWLRTVEHRNSRQLGFFKLEQFWCQSHRAILLELRGVNKDYITDIKTTQDFKVYQLFLSNASKTCAINV